MKRVYAVRDLIAGLFGGGFHLFNADAAAIRMFGDVAVDKNTMIGLHPSDFALLAVAEFDEATGEVTPISPPVVVITGAAWLAAQGVEAQQPLQMVREA